MENSEIEITILETEIDEEVIAQLKQVDGQDETMKRFVDAYASVLQEQGIEIFFVGNDFVVAEDKLYIFVYDDEFEEKFVQPTSWDQLEVGMNVMLLPINAKKGWQKGVLRYNPGYVDPFSQFSLYNLKPFWYIMAKFPGDYGPVTLMLQDLSHIKIPA